MKFKKDLPLKAPSGYFESFPERLYEKIHSQDETRTVKGIITWMPYLAAAVIIIAALVAGSLIFSKGKGNVDFNSQISQAVEHELYSISEAAILEVMSEPQQASEVETDEIIDYLVNEDVRYEDLLNGL